MNFQEAAARFEHSGAGTDDFKLLYKSAVELMGSDVENAALYFVIGVAAHSYVTQYEDQGVTAEFADQAKSVLVGFNKKISQALDADFKARLALLSEVATEYQFRVNQF